MTHDADLAIVGSGFGASVLAMIARRLDLRVILLERGRHPRFAIGESASPLAGILIEQLADRYDLPRLRPLAQYGDWQRAYPNVICGLKRGFTYFKHRAGERFRDSERRSQQLLVAASPNDDLSDTHWLRSDVDYFLLREAESLGAEYLDCVSLTSIDWDAGGTPTLTGSRHGQNVRVRARAVIDGSGARGFLGKALNIPDRGFDGYPRTQALFSHFTDVARCEEMAEYNNGARVRGYEGARVRPTVPGCDGAMVRPTVPGCGGTTEMPPYPMDDAALHHVFDGGWMWVLRFGNGVTSAGIAVTDDCAEDLRLADGEPAWRRFLARYPSIGEQFAGARSIREFTWMPRLAYRAAEAAGPGWAMLPSAAAFVDPLFSTGIPMTLLGVERLARLLEAGEFSGRPGRSVDDYNTVTMAEADHTARFIAGCYAAFPRFEVFAAYSMFYFTAASFSETARRLEVPNRPRRFLCSDHSEFGSATGRLSPTILAEVVNSDEYASRVTTAVDALNIAGMCDATKRNWYGLDPEDTVRAAAKLGVTADEVREMFVGLGLL